MNTKETFDFAPIAIGVMRLGTWGANMSTAELTAFIEGCLELGLNDFDHADIYGGYSTESDFGEVLKSRSDLRDQVRVITKCGILMPCDNRPEYAIKSYDLSASHIRKSVENSLSYLGLEQIDVLLLHRPDLLIDPEEVAGEFEALKQAGKVAFFGVSNFTPSQFSLLNSYTPLVTNQIEASITQLAPFNDGTLDQCIQHQIRPMAWSPVGGGSLFKPSDDPGMEQIRKVAASLAEKYGIQMDQLLLAWLLKHPSKIVPVLGTSKLERVATAKAALEVDLSREDWYRLLEASMGHEVA